MSQQHWNPPKNNGSLLWLKMAIGNRYIYIWIRKHLLLPPCRGDCTDWDLRQSVEEKILLKSSCAAIHDNFDVPKTSIQRYRNLIFSPLKCSSLKHLWYLMSLGKISNKTVRKTITENIVKIKLGHKSYLLKDKEAYIAETIEIEGAHALRRDTTTISDELQQVLHDVGHQDTNNPLHCIPHSGIPTD